MATQNISFTAGSAHNETFTAGTAATTDKILAVIYDTGGAILSKKSAEYGGSTNEIGITASTNYILKLSAAETAAIPSGATYNLVKMDADGRYETELFTGTLTVASASVVLPDEINSAPSYRCTKYVDSDGEFFTIPAGCMIEAVILGPNASFSSSVLDIGTSENGAEIKNDAALSDSVDVLLLPADLSLVYFAAETPIYATSADIGYGLDITVIYKKVMDV